MPTHVLCPGCRIPLLVSPEHQGTPLRCPACHRTFALRTPARATRLQPAGATGRGRLPERNEDGLLIQHILWVGRDVRHELAVAAVADGLGGHPDGDRASVLAIGCITRSLAPWLAGLVAGEEPVPTAETLLDTADGALWEAHRTIARAAAAGPESAGMGATAILALVVDGLAAVCHVGDCRAYHWRGGKLSRLTRDQTLVARLVELGQLSEVEAEHHPSAGQVRQALGRQFDLEPSRRALELAVDDVLLLACDGLHTQVEEGELAALLGQGDSRAVAARLVERADAAGGRDNCTVAVVRCV